ncbi:unnamed protein product [marine sediment metagenome]|uniref:Uncharacterized protein n=1 Tax=marine sediment metagenome TaxID=412755 RepID=X1A316_9ZZZZ
MKMMKSNLMEQFEKDNPGKHAIWNDKITDRFKEWKKKYRDPKTIRREKWNERIGLIIGLIFFIFLLSIGPILLIQGIIISNDPKYLNFSAILIPMGIIFIIIPIAIFLFQILLMEVFNVHIPNGADYFFPLISYVIELVIFVIVEIIFIIPPYS